MNQTGPLSSIVFYSIGVDHPIAPDEPLPPRQTNVLESSRSRRLPC